MRLDNDDTRRSSDIIGGHELYERLFIVEWIGQFGNHYHRRYRDEAPALLFANQKRDAGKKVAIFVSGLEFVRVKL